MQPYYSEIHSEEKRFTWAVVGSQSAGMSFTRVGTERLCWYSPQCLLLTCSAGILEERCCEHPFSCVPICNFSLLAKLQPSAWPFTALTLTLRVPVFDFLSVLFGFSWQNLVGNTSTATKETPDKAEWASGQLEVGTPTLTSENMGDFATIWREYVWEDEAFTAHKEQWRVSSQATRANTSSVCRRLSWHWTYKHSKDLQRKTCTHIILIFKGTFCKQKKNHLFCLVLSCLF